MKSVAVLLAVLLSVSMGFIFGGAVKEKVSKETIAKNCDKLGGFTVERRVYVCSRKSN